MNLSINWLNDFVNTRSIDIKEFCDRMTDTGSKVESYETLGADILNVVVGKIIKIEKHPDSDHLQICQLSDGEAAIRQIVTGAQNVFEGAIVPVAKAPATLPGGVTIKAGKLRGVDSNGMLCSIGELGLTEHDMPGADNDGIFILNNFIPKGTPLGTDIREVLMLSDDVVEFEITSNRPDCLSVIGLAREAKVTFNKPLTINIPVVTENGGSIADYLTVDVAEPALCPRYTARVIKNVKIAPSPLWMRMRLRAAGVRPINNIVDITNYVMLEYGQPMHAFDYAMLDGSHITVRRAGDKEVFVSLDGIAHTLNNNNLVIADGTKAVALAGVMGGANSEIKENTHTVVFESACFDGASVRITAKSQGMRTESSSRFEKGLDPENCIPALDRACELITALGAGEVVSGAVDIYKNKKQTREIPFEPERINRFLGVRLDREYMVKILLDLGFGVENDIITVPSGRGDVAEMNDIAEEIIRIYGYNKIESTPFVAAVKAGALTDMQAFRETLHSLICGMGFMQSNTFSFVSPKNDDRIMLAADSPLRKHTVISNPLGEDTSVMRTSLIPGILDVLEHNNAHNTGAASFYELGHIYIPDEDPSKLPAEPNMLAMASLGQGDFYTLKGCVDALLKACGIVRVKYEACANDPTFHPGRCADVIVRGNRKIGIIGQIHPVVASNYGITAPVFVAYFPVEELFEVSDFKKQYKQLPKFPATARDFSFICDSGLEVGTIDEIIRKSAGRIIENAELFDIYTGVKMAPGTKSVSYRITFRAADHTLTDEEVNKAVDKILASLDKQLGINIRR